MHGRSWWAWGLVAALGGAVGCGGVGSDEAGDTPSASEERGPGGEDNALATRAQALDETQLQLVFDATADVTVSRDTPDTNAGTETRLRSDGSPMEWSYLRFAVQGVNAKLAEGWQVSNMYLRLYATAATNTGFYVYEGPTGWSESTLTWNTRPQMPAGGYHYDEYRSFHPTVAAETYVDAYAAPQDGDVLDGTYNYILSPIGIDGCCTSTDGTSFVARDSSLTAKRPRLVVELTRESTPPPASQTLRFEPAADATARAAEPTRNFGTAAHLYVDQQPDEESFLRFQVSGVTGTVSRAVLRIYAENGSTGGPALYRTGASWAEWTLTWNTRPAREGGTLGQRSGSTGQWLEYDVTSQVSGNGAVGFVLVPTSSDGADFASREATNAGTRPQLVLTVDSSGGQVLAASSYDLDPDVNGAVAHHAGSGDVLMGWGGIGKLQLQRRSADNQLRWERLWPVVPPPPGGGGTDGEAASGVVYRLAFAPDGSAWGVLKWRWGTVDLGSGPLPQGDYLVKLSAGGQVTHVRALRQPGSAIFAEAVDVDPTGHVAVAGAYTGTVDFGAGPVTGPYGAERRTGFVARYTPAGALLWVRSFANTEDATAHAVDTGPAGEVLVGGTARGQDRTTFGGVIVASQYDAFGGEGVLGRLGADGTVQWAKGVGQTLNHVAFSQLGTAVALGTGDFVTWAGQDTQGPPTFLITAEPNGAERWIRRTTGTAYGLGVDDAGSARVLIASGDFTGTPAPTGRPLALVRINLDGNHRWTTWMSRLTEDFEFAVQPHLALASDGRSFVFGAYSGTASFGGFTLQSSDSRDSVLLRVAP
ncbi:DNRLRE domain-containing protein [Pyxidicoccus sp. 3LFB2]